MIPTNFEIIERASRGIQVATAFLEKYPACQNSMFGMIIPVTEPEFIVWMSENREAKRKMAKYTFGPDGWEKKTTVLNTHYDYTKIVDGVTVTLRSAEQIQKLTDKPATATL